uniref:Egl-9 family hypoxia inducible factor 1 n=1 Tax=Salmo trutta TaxID=8032 RepID=A0A674C2N5_SALTR
METKHKTAAQTAQDLERERESQYCELCGKMENLLKCGRCRNSFYCSKEHQKQHWKMHKLIYKESEVKVSKRKPAERQEPSGDWVKGQTQQRKTSAASRSGEAIMKGFITKSTPRSTTRSTTRSTPRSTTREYIVPCMTKHGICVVDNFLGGETGLAILEDVKVLHKTVNFTDGQLGDKITWIEGREAGCEKIRFLMSHMDDLARHCNGHLGNFTINGRTKVSSQPVDVVWPACGRCVASLWTSCGQPVDVVWPACRRRVARM